MQLSIRNQLAGTVVSVAVGKMMSTVRIRLINGQEITAAITVEAVEDLGLAEGSAVVVLMKSTEMAIATAPLNGISIRNRIPGTVTGVDHGDVMTMVKVAIAGGQTLTAAITKDGAEDLGLAEGTEVTALVKSTEVSVALP